MKLPTKYREGLKEICSPELELLPPVDTRSGESKKEAPMAKKKAKKKKKK
jgi:hypothetical protein